MSARSRVVAWARDIPVGLMLRSRRAAVADGELRRMWPRLDRVLPPHPDSIYHSPTGECPSCNPGRRTP